MNNRIWAISGVVAVTLLLVLGVVFLMLSFFVPAEVRIERTGSFAAQSSDDSLANLLRELPAFSVEFVHPVALLGQSADVGDGTSVRVDRIGHDFVCFVSQAQSVTQRQCVPFSNIASVLFAE